MNANLKRFLYWTPRVLCILFAAFLGLFALDVFGEAYTFWESVLAFLIHLAPVYAVLLVLLLAWRWEWVGTVAFAGLAVFYVVSTGGRQHWSAYAIISGGLVVLSVLFLLNWIYRKQLQVR